MPSPFCSPPGTSYDPSPASASYVREDPHARVTAAMDAAAGKSYQALRSAHIADYRALYNRVALDIGQARPTVPTNTLRAGYSGQSRDLEALYFQYGRYLLISSSRAGSPPANLQGIWNESNSPPWNCDYHSNINVQMIYWPAEVTQLGECHESLIEYIEKQQPAWTAQAAKLGVRGWTLLTENNLFGMGNWNANRPANAWYAMHLWDRFDYGLDVSYLRTRAYPLMKTAAEFWLDRLIVDPDDGTLVAPDEWSPEQGPWEKGVSYAQQLIWELFTTTVRATEILDVDAEFRATLKEALGKLDPGTHVGSWGQLREWKLTDDMPNNTHRHISHFVALHPGNQISPLTEPALAEAARVALVSRGDGGTGWAKGWRVSAWARLFDGNRAQADAGVTAPDQHARKSLRQPPAVPDRRQLRRHGGDGRDAAPEPPGDSPAARAADHVGGGQRARAARARRLRGRPQVGRRRADRGAAGRAPGRAGAGQVGRARRGRHASPTPSPARPSPRRPTPSSGPTASRLRPRRDTSTGSRPPPPRSLYTHTKLQTRVKNPNKSATVKTSRIPGGDACS